MRIATYNTEWFVNLFDVKGRLLEDGERSSRYNVTRAEQLRALGAVFAAVDADAVMVIEAPDTNGKRHTVPMLQAFAARFGLRTTAAMIGFPSETQQEIALLYDPARLTPRHDPQEGPEAPRFDRSLRIDLGIDGVAETAAFSKPPLELAVETATGRKLRMIGVHAKSKAPHGARTAADAARIAVQNRRKQLAESLWLRRRVEAHLTAGDTLVVLGDFNDGPGLDDYEKQFGRSGLDIVTGQEAAPALRMFDPHAQAVLGPPTAAQPASARFYLSDRGQFFSAMLDFVMVSPDLAAQRPVWRIWHPFDDPAIYRDPPLREALLTASDHFPVTVDLEI